MSCEQFDDSYALYALGSLEDPEAGAMEEHLRTGCLHCHSEIQQAMERARLISSSVPMIDPPARLRQRVHSLAAPQSLVAAQGTKRAPFWPWLIAAAACLGLIATAMVQYRTSRSERQTLQMIASQNARVSNTIAILGTPGTVEFPLRDPSQPKLTGSLYVHKKLGMVMVINQLPEAPRGWVYETWLMPKRGAPSPVEPLHSDLRGRVLSVKMGPIEIGSFMAMAISLEPQGSHPTKPTAIIFTARV